MNLSLSNDMKRAVSYRLVSQMEKTAIQSLLSLGIDPDDFELNQISDTLTEQSTPYEKALRQVGHIVTSMTAIKEQMGI